MMTLSNVFLALLVTIGLGVVAVVGVAAYIDYHREHARKRADETRDITVRREVPE